MLGLAELKALISSRSRSLSSVADGNIRYVSATDVLYEIEAVKKTGVASLEWKGITKGTSAFHSELLNGHICRIDLDSYAIENGLFEIGDDHRKVKLWEPAANRNITPEQSARLICLKYADDCYGTALHDDALTLYYGPYS